MTRAALVIVIAAACTDAASSSDSVETCTAKCDADGSNIQRFKFNASGRYLIVEVLRDDLAHFELSAVGSGPDVKSPIWTSPMVAKRDYPGPTHVSQNGSTIETPELQIDVDTNSLCVTTTDKVRGFRMTTLCPLDLDHDWKGLTLTKESMRNAYGLGQQFIAPGLSEGDWVGRVRFPGVTADIDGGGFPRGTGFGMDGNAMVPFGNPGGGMVGNTQIPILYAVGEGTNNYALFLDLVYKQRWDFTGDPWRVQMWGDQIRWYVITGPSLANLRHDYMELVGRPLVPPKKAFGLWVSEYGYRNWGDVEDKLSSMRLHGFPVDGFVLDLFWFGGVTSGSDFSNMGRLTWDTANFPDPARELASLRDRGVGILPIEESYVSRGLAEHGDLAGRGFLARDGSGAATYLTGNPWWGTGGMIDWSNAAAGDYWHDLKRQPLIDMGIAGHWTDLGEPEMYDGGSLYFGFPELGKNHHADIHNVFNLDWAASIARGYKRNGVAKRPWIVSRSGAAGIQRYGAGMWSADIGSNMESLATQANAQMHMSMSGIDYYASDTGGFHREALDGDLDELYTQWFANAAMFDFPIKPHTENLCRCKQTAPDRIGDMASNLANLELRYALSPYLYSVAHRAHEHGDPLVPPLVYYFERDPNVRSMGHEKMVGPSLLAAIVARHGETARDVYLPAGTWFDFHSGQSFASNGAWFRNFSEWVDGRFTLPLFARAGAIIPEMRVDGRTMNISGQRSDGTRADDLLVRVYADATPSELTLVEDDGETTGYLRGEMRTTSISQLLSGKSEMIAIGAAAGSFAGATDSRGVAVELVSTSPGAQAVTLDGDALVQQTTRAAFDAASSGWFNAGNHMILAKGPRGAVTSPRTFVVTLQ
jgi:alpha-glucosidase (family GH31 glycosyl hydrolase)